MDYTEPTTSARTLPTLCQLVDMPRPHVDLGILSATAKGSLELLSQHGALSTVGNTEFSSRTHARRTLIQLIDMSRTYVPLKFQSATAEASLEIQANMTI